MCSPVGNQQKLNEKCPCSRIGRNSSPYDINYELCSHRMWDQILKTAVNPGAFSVIYAKADQPGTLSTLPIIYSMLYYTARPIHISDFPLYK